MDVDLQIASEASDIPAREEIERWALAAMQNSTEAELSVRVVDNDESRALNFQYRQKDKPTNVLSFPADLPGDVDLELLGDLVVCAPVVSAEARQQGKTAEAHWAHMIVHGTLHLQGFDHIDDAEAEIMEALETRILSEMGYPAPYEND